MEFLIDYMPIIKEDNKIYFKILSGNYKDVEFNFETIEFEDVDNEESMIKYSINSDDESILNDSEFIKITDEILQEVIKIAYEKSIILEDEHRQNNSQKSV